MQGFDLKTKIAHQQAVSEQEAWEAVRLKRTANLRSMSRASLRTNSRLQCAHCNWLAESAGTHQYKYFGVYASIRKE